jgi:hypothetical protein
VLVYNIGGVDMDTKQTKEDLTVKQLAERAGLTPSRIRQLLNDGTIKGRKYGDSRGGFWLIDHEEGMRFLASRK